MEQLPEVLQRHIASFLSYDQRVEVNKYIPNEYKYIKKIDSDAHNLFVKSELFKRKMERVNNTPTSAEKVMATKEMFTYLLNTKDDCLFVKTSKRLPEAMRRKAVELLEFNQYPPDVQWKRVRAFRSVCERLISKIDSKTHSDVVSKIEVAKIV